MTTTSFKITKVTKSLPCQLSDDDKIEIGKELSDLVMEKVAEEAEKKSVTQSFNARIKIIEKKIKGRAELIERGEEDRMIDCEVKYNTPVYGQKTFTRLDTMESWEENMTDQEVGDLFINAEPNQVRDEDSIPDFVTSEEE